MYLSLNHWATVVREAKKDLIFFLGLERLLFRNHIKTNVALTVRVKFFLNEEGDV